MSTKITYNGKEVKLKAGDSAVVEVKDKKLLHNIEIKDTTAVEPITITENGVYPVPKGGSFEFDKEYKFKDVITREDIEAYMKNATPEETDETADTYVIYGASFSQTIPFGILAVGNDVSWATIMCTNTPVTDPAAVLYCYVLNAEKAAEAGAIEVPDGDGWYSFGNAGPVKTTAPSVTIASGTTMSADLATTAVFFDIETKSLDGWGEITVNVSASGETSANIKPLTVTEVGTFDPKNPLQYGAEIKFKKVITEEDFQAYMANAIGEIDSNGMTQYTIGGEWGLIVMPMGETTIYMLSGGSVDGVPAVYALNASAISPTITDGWLSTTDGQTYTPLEIVPSIVFSKDLQRTCSADIETASVLLEFEEADAFVPVIVNSPALSVMIEGVRNNDDNGAKKVAIVDEFATAIDIERMKGMHNITAISLPNVVTIYRSAVSDCYALKVVNLPKATEIQQHAFDGCSALLVVNIPSATTIGVCAFQLCRKLHTVILGGEAVCSLTLSSTGLDPFNACYHFSGEVADGNPDGLKDGYFYVPKALIEEYKVAEVWSKYADQFRAIEDYPEICEF